MATSQNWKKNPGRCEFSAFLCSLATGDKLVTFLTSSAFWSLQKRASTSRCVLISSRVFFSSQLLQCDQQRKSHHIVFLSLLLRSSNSFLRFSSHDRRYRSVAEPTSLRSVRNKFSLGDMHTSKRKIKDTRFYVVQQKPTSTERTRTQLTL